MKPYTVTLKSKGNPDLCQDPKWGLPGVYPRLVKVSTFKEASEVCLAYIKEFDLGSGNWAGGQIYSDIRTKVAQVNYNGRVVDHIDGTEIPI